jgi:hypothetical protein
LDVLQSQNCVKKSKGENLYKIIDVLLVSARPATVLQPSSQYWGRGAFPLPGSFHVLASPFVYDGQVAQHHQKTLSVTFSRPLVRAPEKLQPCHHSIGLSSEEIPSIWYFFAA